MHRNPVCPSCSHSFSIRDSQKHNTKQPLLLQCGHACCENCLDKLSRAKKNNLPCAVCEEVTDLSKAEKGVKSLHPDIYIYGVIHVNRSSLLDIELRRIRPAGAAVQKPDREMVTGGVMKSVLCRECKQEASCRCSTCNTTLCGKCFDKIHSIFDSLRFHQAQFLDDMELKEEKVYPIKKMMCPTHPNRQIEYICELDNKFICSTCCISGDHKGHEVISIEEKNKSYVEELEPVVQTGSRVLKRLKSSEKRLEQYQPNVSTDSTRLVEEVRAHFRWLHGCLQVREAQIIAEILNKFTSAHSEKSVVVQGMRSQLKQAQCNLAGLLRDAKRVLSNNNDIILSAKDILDQLVEALEMPCSLVCKQKDDTDELQLEWSDTDDIVSSIKKHGVVNGSLEPDLTLITISESGPDPSDTISETCSVVSSTTADSDVIIEEEIDESLSETASTASRPLSRQSSTAEPPKLQLPRSTQISRKTSKPSKEKSRSTSTSRINKQLREVQVTHIHDPSSFLVQQCADLRQLTILQTNINKWCNNPENQKYRPDKLKTGDLIMANYSKNDTWYRGRVKQVVTEKSDKDDPEKEVIVKVEVVYFDYGNSEIVTLGRILKMQARFMKHSDFALECCLYDIVYLEGESCWSQDAIQTLFEMTDGKTLVMSVIQEDNSVLHVDLCKPPSVDIKDDCTASVRDALVFLGLANYYSQSHPSATPPGYVPTRKFLCSEPKQVRDSFEVVVSHCNSPDSFYVQELDIIDGHYLNNMMVDMQEVYGSDKTGMWNILFPQKGMICAAPYDDTWRRAIVIEVPGHKFVKVKYVDHGNIDTLPSLQLKKLLDKFLCLPMFAIHCQLADVIPVEEGRWSDKALDWFKKNLENAKCTATVIRASTEKLHLQLVTVIDDLQYCLNWKLVVDKMAVSTGKSSRIPKQKNTFVENNPYLLKTKVVQAEADTTADTGTAVKTSKKPKKTVLYRKRDRQDVISSYLDMEQSVSSSSSMSSLPTERGEESVKSQKISRQSEPGIITVKKEEGTVSKSSESKEGLSSPQKESTEEDTMTKHDKTSKKKTKKKRNTSPPAGGSLKIVQKPVHKSPLGVKIVVTHCESPSTIYIQMVTAMQDGLERLMGEMKDAYSRTSPCLVTWKPDDYCAAKRADDQWYRGKVLRAISDSKFEVFMEDFGDTEEMDVGSLQGLSDRFIQNYGSFLQKCHLADIAPTGDSTNWSRTAVEYVSSEVRRKSCFLLEKGEKDEVGSQPIDLLIEVVIQESALEPAIRDFYSLSERLKEKGLAMPVRKKNTKPVLLKADPATAALEALSQKSPERSPDEMTSPTSPTSPIVEPMIMLKPPCAFYKHPEVPTVKSLSVIPTYVDYGCIIFVHLVGRNDETDQLLDEVIEKMQSYFNQPTLYSTPTEWKVGQACAAYYSVDKHWYRGKVIEVPVSGDKLRVQYIDYGNAVWLSKDMVRADVNQFVDIPQLAVECVLHRIQPSAEQHGTWSTSVLETIHELLVNKDCTAQIEDVSEDGVLSIRLYLEGDVDVGELLCSQGLAIEVLDIKEREELSKNILTILQENNPYSSCDLPSESQIFSVLISHMDMPDVVYFQRSHPDMGETDDFSKLVSFELKSLVQLSAEINEFALLGRPFEKPRPGAPCCAQFSFDGRWYRALMISIRGATKEAFVYFVDYGNSEFVPFDRLRIMPAQFMMLSAQASRCQISNIAPPGGQSWNNEALQAMTLLIGNRNIKAQLTCSGPQQSAVLFSNSEGTEFIYQSLVDQGLVVLKQPNISNVKTNDVQIARDWCDMVEENEEVDFLNDIELDSSSDTTLEDKSEELRKRTAATSSDSAKKSSGTSGDDSSNSDDDDVEWETTENSSDDQTETKI